jgi:hypothetical protein
VNERKEKQMSDELSPELANSAVYIFNRNAKIHFGGSDAEAHAAGVAAHYASVWGHDAKKDSAGRFIAQGQGSHSNPTQNHLAALRKYEGEAAYQKELRRIWRETPDIARRRGFPEPTRAGA